MDCKDTQNYTSRQNYYDWRSALRRLDGAYAEGTLRAYHSDIAAFVAWCDDYKINPFPAHPQDVAAFITYETERLTPSTVKRRLAAIRKIHSLFKFSNPLEDEDVNLAIRRAFRKKYTRPRQAAGLTKEVKERLINACDNSLRGKRNKALLATGYDILARRSELVALKLEDLSLLKDGSGNILIRRSKNDAYGSGRLGHISPYCLALIIEWIKTAKIEEGYLFPQVKGLEVGTKPLNPATVNRIVKNSAKLAGFAK